MPTYISGEYITYALLTFIALVYVLSRNNTLRGAIRSHGMFFDLLVIGASIAVVLIMFYLPTILSYLSP